MARPNKTGIDYFPFDIVFFDDDKIQLIESEFGMKGGYIAIRLLCKIYKEGYFYKWGTDECLLFTKSIATEGISKKIVDEIVNGLVKRGFFDKHCFDKFGILTSRGIQKRYFEIVKRYKSVDAESDYLLVDVSTHKNVNIRTVNKDTNPENDDTNEQKKGKEIKGNKTTWRDDFEIYLFELTNAYKSLVNDPEFIAERQRYHPHIDIRLTLEKSYKDYWCTEEAWKKRKRSKTNELDWRATLRNSLDQKFNQVYLNKSGSNEQTTIHIIS